VQYGEDKKEMSNVSGKKLSPSSRRRRKNSDNQIYQTEFGPVDGRTRRFVGYLIMGIFGLMALGVTSAWFTMDHGPLYDPISGLVMIGIVDLLLLGLPAIVFFGQKEPDYAERSEYTETHSPSIFASVNNENASDDSDKCQKTATTEESMTVEEMETEPEPKQKAKTKTDADYSYRNEWPKRKRIDGRTK